MYKFVKLFSKEARRFAASRKYRETDRLPGGTRIRDVKEEDDGTTGLYCPIGNMIDHDFPGKCATNISYRAPVSGHVLALFNDTKLAGATILEQGKIAGSVSTFIHDFETGNLGPVDIALGV